MTGADCYMKRLETAEDDIECMIDVPLWSLAIGRSGHGSMDGSPTSGMGASRN